jgi:membrane fusion protein, multidrug efflux system
LIRSVQSHLFKEYRLTSIRQGRTKQLTRFVLSPLFVLLSISSLFACNNQAEKPAGPSAAANPAAPAAPAGAPAGAPPAPEVSVITVQAANQSVDFEYSGQTIGSRETEVRARVPGIIQKRLFEEGSIVKVGTPLYQIDTATFQNQLASADAAVSVAQARFSQSKRDEARLAPLVAEKAISQKEFDDARSALELAGATLRQTQALAKEARLNLSYTKVVAPISGVTGVSAKSDGSLLSSADSLLTTIIQTDPMFVNFSVPESEYLRLNKQVNAGQLNVPGKAASNGSLGFSVKVKLADGTVHPQGGTLNFASNRVNAQNGNVDVRAQIPNPDGSLKPGQFVRVLLGGATRPNVISVPQRAVIDSPFGKIVFVVSPDNKLSPRPIELDGWSKGNWIIAKGLQNGERVLVEGFIKANQPGMTVKPVPYVPASIGAQSAPPPAAAPAPVQKN